MDMRFLRSNTAVIVTVGPFYDKTDGVTIETALTITNERITLTADTDEGSAPTNILDNITGATAATDNDLNYITGNDAGMMQLELSAANVNRVGRMFLSITDAANHVPVFHEFFVLPQVIYDWLTAGVAPLSPTVTGRTLDVSAGGEAGVDWANVGSPTTALNLSATNIDVDQVVASVSGAVGSVTGAVGSVTGNVTGTVGGFAAGQGPRIRKNVALAAFPFVMTDSTNHAPATGLTVTATRSLDGAAFAACANAVTEIANGWYKISLAATDVNADTVAFRFTAAASDDLVFTVVTNP